MPLLLRPCWRGVTAFALRLAFVLGFMRRLLRHLLSARTLAALRRAAFGALRWWSALGALWRTAICTLWWAAFGALRGAAFGTWRGAAFGAVAAVRACVLRRAV